LGSYADSIIDPLKTAYESRVFTSLEEFYDSKYGDVYDAVYPITLNPSGAVDYDDEDSFYSGSMRLATPVKSVSITRNATALPLTKVASKPLDPSADAFLFDTGHFDTQGLSAIFDTSEPPFVFTQKTRYVYGERIGGRNLFDVTNGRSYVGSTVGGEKRTKQFEFPVNSGIKFDSYDVPDKVSPYVLMPEDELAIACIVQPAPYDPSEYIEGIDRESEEYLSQPSIEKNIPKFKTRLSGPGRIVLYGSYLRDGEPIAPESSQPLTSLALHEDVRGDLSPYGASYCMDQFQLEPRTSLRNGYLDRIVVDGINNWLMVSAGETHSLGIREDGTLWAWGDNLFGQLGIGTDGGSQFSYENPPDSNTPARVVVPNGHPGTWNQVSAGNGFSLGIDSNGKAWAWGSNFSGQLGIGTSGAGSDKNIPTAVNTGGGSPFTYILLSAGGSHSLGISADPSNKGKAWAWGSNLDGQLGLIGSAQTPTAIDVDHDRPQTYELLSAGYDHSLGIDSNGKAWAWGSNFYQQLGNGTDSDENLPVAVSTDGEVPTVWKQLSAGGSHSLGIAEDGTAWAWGLNGEEQLESGNLGDGTYIKTNIPTAVDKTGGRPSTWKQLSASKSLRSHSLGISADPENENRAWSWGYNLVGQLGNGTTVGKNAPTPLNTDDNEPLLWKQVSAGGRNFLLSHSLGVSYDDRLWSWGNNSFGQLGIGNQDQKLVPSIINVNPILNIDIEDFRRKNREAVGSIIDRSLILPSTDDFKDSDFLQFKKGLQRFVRLFNARETYYDSHIPSVRSLLTTFNTGSVVHIDIADSESNASLLFFSPFDPKLDLNQRSDNVQDAANGEDSAKSLALQEFRLVSGSIEILFAEKKDLNASKSVTLLYGIGDGFVPPFSDSDEDIKNILRGYRYGLSGIYPIGRSACFRHDRYGQFRDMFETSGDSVFFEEVETTGGTSRGLGASPIKIRFVQRQTQERVLNPEETNSQNLSFFATSSLPYFDGLFNDRTTIQPDLIKPDPVENTLTI
jgi:alpha-tubulin suppressor-like RCC1 family protein